MKIITTLILFLCLVSCTKRYTTEECTNEVVKRATTGSESRQDQSFAYIGAHILCTDMNNNPDRIMEFLSLPAESK